MLIDLQLVELLSENLHNLFFNKIKKSAEQRNIEFSDEITLEYLWNLFLKQGERCALTGDKNRKLLKNQCENGFKEDNDLSLDRIDSTIGYIPGNVQWVSKQINISKHILSSKEFIEMCRKVVNYANQQPSQPLTKLEGSETNSWNYELQRRI